MQYGWEEEAAAWAADRRELLAAIAYVQTLDGWAADELAELSLPLDPTERVFVVHDGAALVERPKGGDWGSGDSGFSAQRARRLRWDVSRILGVDPPSPGDPVIGARGQLIVTDRRVAFLGARRQREWAFDRLVGYRHLDSAPITTFHMANLRRVSGVLYRKSIAGTVQLRLAIAVARATGTTDDLLTSLHAELAWHDAIRPRGRYSWRASVSRPSAIRPSTS